MIPYSDEKRAKDVRALVAKAKVMAELHEREYVVVPHPPLSEIHAVEDDLPFYVEAADATPWMLANGRLVKPGDA